MNVVRKARPDALNDRLDPVLDASQDAHTGHYCARAALYLGVRTNGYASAAAASQTAGAAQRGSTETPPVATGTRSKAPRKAAPHAATPHSPRLRARLADAAAMPTITIAATIVGRLVRTPSAPSSAEPGVSHRRRRAALARVAGERKAQADDDDGRDCGHTAGTARAARRTGPRASRTMTGTRGSRCTKAAGPERKSRLEHVPGEQDEPGDRERGRRPWRARARRFRAAAPELRAPPRGRRRDSEGGQRGGRSEEERPPAREEGQEERRSPREQGRERGV